MLNYMRTKRATKRLRGILKKELREIKKWGDGGKYYEPEDVLDDLEGVIDVATDYARKGPDSMQTELDFKEEY